MIWIRHAETEWNIEGRHQGHHDAPLSERGENQAFALAKRMRSFHFNHLYSSDLGRTLKTAEKIKSQTGHHIHTDSRLREGNLGIFEGLTPAQAKRQYPREYDRYLMSPEYVIPDGESVKQRFDRNVACFEALASNHPGQTLAVVSHGGVLDSLFRYVLLLPLNVPRRFSYKNTSIAVVTHENSAWQLESWGDVSHLNPNAVKV